ncbi:MAG: hypothetical protein WC986_14560 [Elusimicrobiota bacterium]|jgi:hypothetical protein
MSNCEYCGHTHGDHDYNATGDDCIACRMNERICPGFVAPESAREPAKLGDQQAFPRPDYPGMTYRQYLFAQVLAALTVTAPKRVGGIGNLVVDATNITDAALAALEPTAPKEG